MRKPTIWVSTRSDTNWPVQSQKMAEAGNFDFRKQRNYTICVAKTKAMISFAITAELICSFVFAYTDCWFSHALAQILQVYLIITCLITMPSSIQQDHAMAPTMIILLNELPHEKTNNLHMRKQRRRSASR